MPTFFSNPASRPALDDQTFADNAFSYEPTWGEALGPLMRGGVRNTYGLGTALRYGETIGFGSSVNPTTEGKPLDEDAWKKSEFYREGVAYSSGMTEGRAKRIAEAHDEDAVYQWYAAKRPWQAMFTGFAGGLADPINYIPVVSQYSTGMNLAGKVGLAAADAALNTGASAVLTAPLRAQLGDDVSVGEVARQMAYSAVAGSILGGAFHLMGSRRAAYEVSATQGAASKAAIVLNNVADDVANGRDVKLWPASQDAIRSMHEQITKAVDDAIQSPRWRTEQYRVKDFTDGVMKVEAVDAPSPGIRVYHGSPHDFDRFSMEHIGKGEGAQAYGHGLYFAESEGVAKSYRDQLAPKGLATPKSILQDIDTLGGLGFASPDAAASALYATPNFAKAYDFAAFAQDAPAIREAAKRVEDYFSKPPPSMDGVLYEARIKANPDDFLDWDKPLSEQPEIVRRAISARLPPPGTNPVLDDALLARPAKAGGQEYSANLGRVIQSVQGENAQRLTADLREAGIPGIKYLDGNSRSDGEGTRNYVVFDDSLIEVVGKNGEPVAKPLDLGNLHQWNDPEVDLGNSRILEAEAKVAAPTRPGFDGAKADIEDAVAQGVDPETGVTDWDADIKVLRDAERLNADDLADLDDAARVFDEADAWGKALEVARTCFRG
jgi:hypothetical protein